MKLLFENWKKFLFEEKQIFEVECLLRYEKDFSVYGNVFNQIRAIDGVTVVKVSPEGVINISDNKKAVKLDLRFIPVGNIQRYAEYLRNQFFKLKDKENDKVLSFRFKSWPKKIDL